ncbi:secondary thiamine-phosphate synthase enzyme YjbQ [Jannaschia sp. S6380]|uniref:secondary thiamine-phosphate synthase enzyme YjbQ n=1 Tax=Jannaschia sp. S6380 TaxID=2926408 RepID=UPI001FF6C5EF|nr:secondary thiamine-phosphate synthase enzyme YjbQ [Jannaschia sp. S6380]MCK0169323.1 secondary thiamine-phosphate synthase enzyme YjbQ [Jannaschia sp. S6380]
MHTMFEIRTHGPGLMEFTADVAAWLPAASGLLTLMIRHTSASLLIQENADPEVQVDLTEWLRRTVPPTTDPSMAYLTHTYEGPDDMPGHIKAMLLPVSLQIPVLDGRMRLGTWQGLYLVEHRDRPHTRSVAAHFAADR